MLLTIHSPFVPEEHDPSSFDELSKAHQRILVGWIKQKFIHSSNEYINSTASLRHLFVGRQGPANKFAVTNGQFKGAMCAAGFAPVDVNARYWRFKLDLKR